MVRTLTGEGVPNITQPTAEYPYGKYKDKTSPSTNDGTELSERTLGDCYQGMLNTITGAGMTPNNEPERKGASQFQEAVELLKPIGTAIIGSSDGTSFEVLESKIRVPGITFGVGFESASTTGTTFGGNFHIKRGGSLDTTRNYIVTVSPAFAVLGSVPLTVAAAPRGVAAAHTPYFLNVLNTDSYWANLLFYFGNSMSTAEAMVAARAVVTVYDAGPVS